ncbi:integrase core domain-containing protein [Escherichia coli]|uniref:integrase core domain-containing protein n=1 Tax=Escherichia coli TaxID=562 RepID=UPI0032E8F706
MQWRFEHYNENHPHSALGYRSPREYRRQRVTLLKIHPLSGNKGARTMIRFPGE